MLWTIDVILPLRSNPFYPTVGIENRFRLDMKRGWGASGLWIWPPGGWFSRLHSKNFVSSTNLFLHGGINQRHERAYGAPVRKCLGYKCNFRYLFLCADHFSMLYYICSICSIYQFPIYSLVAKHLPLSPIFLVRSATDVLVKRERKRTRDWHVNGSIIRF